MPNPVGITYIFPGYFINSNLASINPFHLIGQSIPFNRSIHSIQQVKPFHSTGQSIPFNRSIHSIQQVKPFHSSGQSYFPFNRSSRSIHPVNHTFHGVSSLPCAIHLSIPQVINPVQRLFHPFHTCPFVQSTETYTK